MSMQAYNLNIHETSSRDKLFSSTEVEKFQQDGYVISRGLAEEPLCCRMLDATLEGLDREIEPIEFEVDLQYPGSPTSRETTGGSTARRLKQANSRHPVFTEWVTNPVLVSRLQQLLGPNVVMPLAHHNCIMTKMPHFSSDTGWHQDSRYWSYQQPELVSVWLALGREFPENGCLKLIPGTHCMQFDHDQLDEELFLRPDLLKNQKLIGQQVYAELEAGDVLFFHSRIFHAASRNYTDEPKFSAVFTFHGSDNHPIPGTRSASLPEIPLPSVTPKM